MAFQIDKSISLQQNLEILNGGVIQTGETEFLGIGVLMSHPKDNLFIFDTSDQCLAGLLFNRLDELCFVTGQLGSTVFVHGEEI